MRRGVGEVDRRLGLVRQPQHGRQQAGLRQGAHRVGAGVEGRPPPALVRRHGGRAPHAHRDGGDDAEGALRAQQQLTQVGPGGVGRRGAEAQRPGRRGGGEARRPSRRSVRSRRWTARSSAWPRSRRSTRAGRTAGSARASDRARRGAPRPRGRAGPARGVAVIETSSTASSRFIRTRSRLTTPAKPSRRAARPPVTEVPPPNGTTATRCSTAQARTAAHVVVPVGSDDGVGRVVEVAGAGAQQVGGGLAARAQGPRRVVGRARARRRRPPGGRRAARRPARTAGAWPRRPAGRSCSPKASSTSPSAESGRTVAAAGSPQRCGCISMAVGSVTCVTV